MATPLFSEGGNYPEIIPQQKQLLPNIVDGFAKIRPESTWAKIPRDPTSWGQGYRRITYRLLANAVNALATWLQHEFGDSKRPFAPLAYFGVYDPRYTILILAVIKAEFQAVFPAVSRSKESLVQFFDDVDCKIILTASRELKVVQELAESLRVIDIPSLETLLDEPAPHFPCPKTFSSAHNDPVIILHTSGSTGEPKPLTYTNDWLASFIQQNQSSAPPHHSSVEHSYHGVSMFAFTPQAHSGGIFSNLLGTLPNFTSCVYPLPSSTLTLQSMFDTLRAIPVDFLICPTHLLDEISLDRSRTSFLASHARIVGFGGGPLSERTGNILSKHVRLISMYGTGEAGIFPKIIPDKGWSDEQWNLVIPNPVAGVQMRPSPGTEDIYEAVVVRDKDLGLEQPVFKMFPGLSEWETKDCFRRHVLRNEDGGEDLTAYSYAHRRDDAIQLIVADGSSHTRKALFPLEFEQALSRTELIKTALVFGDFKPFPGLLIEVRDPPAIYSQHVPDDVFATIRAHLGLLGREIEMERVIVANPRKPVPRALKGTVQRAAAMQLYRDEIESIYERPDQAG